MANFTGDLRSKLGAPVKSAVIASNGGTPLIRPIANESETCWPSKHEFEPVAWYGTSGASCTGAGGIHSVESKPNALNRHGATGGELHGCKLGNGTPCEDGAFGGGGGTFASPSNMPVSGLRSRFQACRECSRSGSAHMACDNEMVRGGTVQDEQLTHRDATDD